MATPNYLRTFRQAVLEQEQRSVREQQGCEISELSELSTPLISLNTLISRLAHDKTPVFGRVLADLESRRPDQVPDDRNR
jgi:hypothetical protein